MNAVPRPAYRPEALSLAPMTAAWLNEVAHIEKLAYAHPWSSGNFADSLRAGYHACVLLQREQVLGYFVLMKGLDETHLLNITVTPEAQGQGHARHMLNEVAIWSAGQGAQWLWLEVRVSNTRARRIYERYGFKEMGVRRNYYPLAAFKREDAVVMNLPLATAPSPHP
jgi:ribosomal-protein-alanine N-acetyltransferase